MRNTVKRLVENGMNYSVPDSAECDLLVVIVDSQKICFRSWNDIENWLDSLGR